MTPRQAALLFGRTTYETGKPCKHGHVQARFTASGACVACHRAARLKKPAIDPLNKPGALLVLYDLDPAHIKLIDAYVKVLNDYAATQN